ncbi:cell envelope integrity protein CreD [Chitinophaga japonensis]|uniref:Inner membrane protein n=1 Tax=Chitinophaga japonensis TaxID=104662 RepID=A0A562TE59_CHIJA|nr:cell envelope integrity protein CreD [Chitinophaga japonensis]TWI91376.1 inner membrane protein [Chitinophaga japonensis]
METTNTTAQRSFWERYAYAIKAIVIGILVLVLLIPTAMIMGLINERKHLQQQATEEVSAKWANAQTITGPVLVVPYTEINVIKTETAVREEEVLRYACFLPEQLTINGQLQPEIRKRGIYEVAVYGSRFQLSGSFTAPDLAALNISSERLRWNEASLAMGISDMRGIGNQVQVLWNGQPFVFNPGTPPGGLLGSGLQAKVPLAAESVDSAGASFTINLQLKGSGEVNFSPVGKTTRVNLQAGWSDPSFDGAFLPDTRKVEDKHFSAAWQVLHLNRNFPQSWILGNDKYDIHDADFGVKLFLPVDVYLKSMRAVKYAILIIGLTFLLFYFIELLRHHSVHPLQYILIGVALCIFYTLLISQAEQLGFNAAYCIATLLTLGLVTTYTVSVLKKTGTALAVGGTLLTLYGFIYVIIQSEDQALLMGSLGLFIILAIVMYFSRKIRWEALGR